MPFPNIIIGPAAVLGVAVGKGHEMAGVAQRAVFESVAGAIVPDGTALQSNAADHDVVLVRHVHRPLAAFRFECSFPQGLACGRDQAECAVCPEPLTGCIKHRWQSEKESL